MERSTPSQRRSRSGRTASPASPPPSGRSSRDGLSQLMALATLTNLRVTHQILLTIVLLRELMSKQAPVRLVSCTMKFIAAVCAFKVAFSTATDLAEGNPKPFSQMRRPGRICLRRKTPEGGHKPLEVGPNYRIIRVVEDIHWTRVRSNSNTCPD